MCPQFKSLCRLAHELWHYYKTKLGGGAWLVIYKVGTKVHEGWLFLSAGSFCQLIHYLRSDKDEGSIHTASAMRQVSAFLNDNRSFLAAKSYFHWNLISQSPACPSSTLPLNSELLWTWIISTRIRKNHVNLRLSGKTLGWQSIECWINSHLR